MGIIDDMDDFINDHLSVIKRHNVQQTFEVTSSNGQQVSLQEQIDSEKMSRQGLGGQRSQLASVTQQGQASSEHSRSRSQHVILAATSVGQTSSILEHNSRSDRGSTSSDASDFQRSPPVERSVMPSSPFRDRVSWSDNPLSPVGISEFHRSPLLEHVGVSSPFRSSKRTSWIEHSSSSSGCVEQKRNFSFEHLTNSPIRPSQLVSTPTEHQITSHSEMGPTNALIISEQRTNILPDILPLSSPHRSERHRIPHQSEKTPHSSPFRCDCKSPVTDNAKNTAISADQQTDEDITHPPHTTSTKQLVKHSIDVSVAIFSKPKLVRLRSEPCAFSTVTTDTPLRGLEHGGPGSRRTREELKRSQSFEVTSPSYCDTLWTGINVPSQLVITRPQLSGTKLNRKHLSLCLEGVSSDLNSMRPDPPLLFHDTHGENIELHNNKMRARRYESFCNGICFSNRPIAINETVYVKCVETNTTWSGVLRFGFTSVDPATIRSCDLPRYACPDLTDKPGNWAKALGEQYTTKNILLHFSVNTAGDVTYGVNGEWKGVIFSGVVTSQSLWALLDIYGNTVAVEFSHADASIDPPVSAPQFGSNAQSLECDLFNFSKLPVDNAPGSPPADPNACLIDWHADTALSPLQFHSLMGRNILVVSDSTMATRPTYEHCNGYVFTARPICFGETLIIQVLGIDRSCNGGLGFGLTACDPDTVDPGSLPDDSYLLLDRQEYWVVNKDVCRNPEVGDQLSFYMSEDGEVKYARNNQASVTLMHVDRTLQLWAFFDVYGNTKKIKLLGTTMTPCQVNLLRSQSTSSYNNASLCSVSDSDCAGASCGTAVLTKSLPTPHFETPGKIVTNILCSSGIPTPRLSSTGEYTDEASISCPTSPPATPVSLTSELLLEDDTADCKVCWERVINCVLYTCGHMCLCFDCAMTIRSEKGLCPICRRSIVDVIKFYRS